MTAKAATEGVLGELHNKVAKVMINVLDNIETAQERWAEAEPQPDVPLENPPEVSPAMLSAMTKFLSDNKITCQPEESENVSDLAQRLKEKRRRKSVGNVVPLVPDLDY